MDSFPWALVLRLGQSDHFWEHWICPETGARWLEGGWQNVLHPSRLGMWRLGDWLPIADLFDAFEAVHHPPL